ncbi:unnamed protein product [Dicrocoelium dendriticum]|nr:unnamed protein product [Dicrocoelium dendriticum]
MLRLSLPQQQLRAKAGDKSVADTLRHLKRFENLNMLDMGGQVRHESELDAVKEVLAHLRGLREIVFVDLPKEFVKDIIAACKPPCKIRIQRYV